MKNRRPLKAYLSLHTRAFYTVGILGVLNGSCFAAEALTGYDEKTNGYITQEKYQQDLEQFTDVETPETGLGPLFNDSSCVACHHDTAIGASSQNKVVRAGFFDGKQFLEPVDGSLIFSRTIAPVKAAIPDQANVKALRSSLSTLGDGYIEAIADETLIAIANSQPKQMRGEYVWVGVMEATGVQEIGRFGWKSQHSSLLSFSADAYRNEMGITTPMFPDEATFNGHSVAAKQAVPSPNEGDNLQLEMLTDFMRATKAPPRTRAIQTASPLNQALASGSNKNGKNPPSPVLTARSGEDLFNTIGCNICHVPSITTAEVGYPRHGGTYKVPTALANVTLHPYSDFLLHNIGTGDGIVQNGGASTRNKMRTMPLWGLGRRLSFIHDGSEVTIENAVNRHAGEAAIVMKNYSKLSAQDKKNLLNFLESL